MKKPKEPSKKKTDPFSIQGRVWFQRGGKTYLAWGRVVLLERIREYGSLSAAARSMEMSYRHAWELLDKINALAPSPLVIKKIGGKSGGGMTLTPEGERAIREFWKTVKRLETWLEQETGRSEIWGNDKQSE